MALKKVSNRYRFNTLLITSYAPFAVTFDRVGSPLHYPSTGLYFDNSRSTKMPVCLQ